MESNYITRIQLWHITSTELHYVILAEFCYIVWTLLNYATEFHYFNWISLLHNGNFTTYFDNGIQIYDIILMKFHSLMFTEFHYLNRNPSHYLNVILLHFTI